MGRGVGAFRVERKSGRYKRPALTPELRARSRVMRGEGIEPSTFAMSGRHSAAELPAQIHRVGALLAAPHLKGLEEKW